MTSIKKCEVCNENDFKYKCPQCRIKYCSVKCYKQHKAEVCKPPLKIEEEKNNPVLEVQKKESLEEEGEITGDESDDETDTKDKVPIELLQKLEQSSEITKMLENPHLRAMMENLYNSDNCGLDVSHAMQEPIFTEFADECLKIVQPQKID
ncbi:zinc finger HIT domain-containing protein 3 [Patella vulgata]|uniref:zinc finger HIT domain-containing protein 3 n=1 Tax=Patella vulgata TaxID=6465 RepID=UPI00217FA982|nr:zinc finger HIT domain-containing protein 3 [Patella vulgata]